MEAMASSSTVNEATPLATKINVSEASSKATDEGKKQQMGLWAAVCTLTADIMGIGLMTLPYNFAQLGWFWGLSASVVIATLSQYGGWLLSKTSEIYHDNKATSYADLAHHSGGAWLDYLVSVVIVGYWASTLPLFITLAAHSLFLVHESFCTWQAAFIVTMLLLIPTQIRNFTQLQILSAIATVSLNVAALIIVVTIISDSSTYYADFPSRIVTSTWIPQDSKAIHVLSHVASIAFAYNGHSIFLEIKREMEEPNMFMTALTITNAFMFVVYTSIASLYYADVGNSGVRIFLADSVITDRRSRTVVGLLLMFHYCISYAVCALPFHATVQRLAFPKLHSDAPASTWLAVTVTCALVAMVVAITVPNFTDLATLIGSVFITLIVFFLPALFYLRGAQLNHKEMPVLHLVACAVLIFVVSPIIFVGGLTGAISQLQSDGGHLGALDVAGTC